ncbi:phosphatase PAP2 family protein [Ilumatobacter sp.]|uniref:phosphatase PAP2 family protein n=1 Tax=Ilumatobacter sp. TaxID=1967498 RepID=UPI003B51B3AB
MIVVAIVLVAIAVIAALVGARAATSGPGGDDASPEPWVVARSPSWARSWARTLDRRVVGGVVVASTFVVIFVAAVVVGWIFSSIDAAGGIARWDESAARWGADSATETSTTVLDALTRLGGTPYLLPLMIAIGLHRRVRDGHWRAGIYLAVVGLGITVLNNGLKLLVDRERPSVSQLTGYSGTSFPSGHSAAAAACWAAIALVLARHRSSGRRRAVAAAAVVVAVTVAATRVLLGVHWVSDVVAGVVVGWAWFAVATLAFGGRLLRFGEVGRSGASSTPTSSTEEFAR